MEGAIHIAGADVPTQSGLASPSLKAELTKNEAINFQEVVQALKLEKETLAKEKREQFMKWRNLEKQLRAYCNEKTKETRKTELHLLELQTKFVAKISELEEARAKNRELETEMTEINEIEDKDVFDDREAFISKEAALELVRPYLEMVFGSFLILIGVIYICNSLSTGAAVIVSNSMPEVGRTLPTTTVDVPLVANQIHYDSGKSPNISAFQAEPEIKKPWTLGQLQMCIQNPEINNRQIKCDEDPTCKKCLPDNTLTAFIEQFQTNDTIRHLVRDYIETKFGPPTPEKILVLMVSDLSFMPLILNWNKTTESFPEIDLVVVGIDKKAVDEAKKLGFDPMPIFWKFHDAFPWMKAKFMQMAIMAFLADFGYNLIMQDADVFWLQDPRPYMKAIADQDGVDVLCQLAPRWDAQGQCNTGYLYVSNRKIDHWYVKFFWQNLIDISKIIAMIGDDQMVFNALLRHWRFGQLHWQILPFDLFTLALKEDDLASSAITGHVVGGSKYGAGFLAKVDRIQEAGHWMLDWDPVAEHESKQK